MKTCQVASYPLRVPLELKMWLKKRAQRNLRSLNAEMVHRLNQSRQKDDASELAPSEASDVQ